MAVSLWSLCPDCTLPKSTPKSGIQSTSTAAAIPIAGTTALRLTSSTNPSLGIGRGKYTITGDQVSQVFSTSLEYAEDPRQWEDGKSLVCHHLQRNHDCDVSFNVLSNKHFESEFDRLFTRNGILDGPVYGHCGARYLEQSGDFVFNGTQDCEQACNFAPVAV